MLIILLTIFLTQVQDPRRNTPISSKLERQNQTPRPGLVSTHLFNRLLLGMKPKVINQDTLKQTAAQGMNRWQNMMNSEYERKIIPTDQWRNIPKCVGDAVGDLRDRVTFLENKVLEAK